MSKKIFNPKEWIDQSTQKPIETVSHNIKTTSEIDEIEKLLQLIETKQIDLTSAYNDWRDIGFALADVFGESGRLYYHRISRFHANYTPKDCDLQYSNCLKAKGHGITLKTIFYHAKQAGLNISLSAGPDTQIKNPITTLPVLPDTLFPQLPEFLQKVVKVSTFNEERDILLLGSLVCISACLPNIYGVYDGKRVYANLYIFITAQASAGKGRLIHCKQLVNPIHKHFREQAKQLKQQYEIELSEYNKSKSKDKSAEKPVKPPEKMLFIPANNSTTGVFQLIADNDNKGLMFETEGDTLAQAFKTDYGNYSDGFRKAFHHETISYYRRTDREYVDIENPCLSALLSGTPRQVSSLIPNAENGLFSRFIFYFMNIQPVWKNVFAITSDNGLDDYFNVLGNDFYRLYQILQANAEIQFSLNVDQQVRFNIFFEQIQDKYLCLQGLDYMATIRRLGLIAFRFTMILSTLRIMDNGVLPERLICEEQDFNSALELIKVLVIHASKVFTELPQESPLPKRKNLKERFLDELPAVFSRQDYLKLASQLLIPEKTAEGYITDFYKKNLIHRDKQDHYINNNTKDAKEAKEVRD